MERDFDLVIVGATGFVGRQVTAYLAAHAPETVSWAVAGRDPARLARVDGASAIRVADGGDPDALGELARRSRVVLNVAGAAKGFGDALVRACIRNGTHYCDISGDTARIRRLIDICDADARAAGVAVVPFCGASSLPSDVLVTVLDGRLDGALELAKGAVDLRGGLNGGTVASMIEAQINGDALLEADPFLLGPARAPRRLERDPRGLHYDRHLRSWVAASPMGRSDTRAVRLSASLRNRPELQYQEYLAISGALGPVRTAMMAGSLSALNFALRWEPARALIGRRMRPGTGPSPEQIESGYLRIRVWGRTRAGRSAEVGLSAAGDPANRVTALCAAESALHLCLNPVGRAGVLTPGVAFGSAIVPALESAGVVFT